MNKFKVGDKVICIETDEEEAATNNITYGKTHYVVGIDKEGSEAEWLLHLDDGTSACCYRFEPYEKTEMTAEQLRDEILRINSRIEEAKKDIENAEKEHNSLIGKLREKGFEIVKSDKTYDEGSQDDNFKVGDRVEITGYTRGRHDQSHIGMAGFIEIDDHSTIPFKVILDGEDEESNTWFEIDQIKKI